jgi:hypothetical protein
VNTLHTPQGLWRIGDRLFNRLGAIAFSKNSFIGITRRVEPFKTSSIFDATAQNPDWLGEEPQRIQQLMSA